MGVEEVPQDSLWLPRGFWAAVWHDPSVGRPQESLHGAPMAVEQISVSTGIALGTDGGQQACSSPAAGPQSLGDSRVHTPTCGGPGDSRVRWGRGDAGNSSSCLFS